VADREKGKQKNTVKQNQEKKAIKWRGTSQQGKHPLTVKEEENFEVETWRVWELKKA
jgi:hypothetical protein